MILDPVLHAAVAGGGDLPVERQLEILKRLAGEKVFHDFGVSDGLQAGILDDEGIPGRMEPGGVPPTGEGAAVEEQPPAGGLLLSGKSIVRGRRRLGQNHCGRQRGQSGPCAHTSFSHALRRPAL